MALLPPIPLYRRLLRAHRKHLPTDMRVLGDEYIKAEFRAHRKVDNPAHLVSLAAKESLLSLEQTVTSSHANSSLCVSRLASSPSGNCMLNRLKATRGLATRLSKASSRR